MPLMIQIKKSKMKKLDDGIREIYEVLETLNEGKKEKIQYIFQRRGYRSGRIEN